MKLGTLRNPKFLRLARTLGTGKAAAAGHLEALWAFASEQAPAGDVGRWEDEDIEEACFWEGDTGALVDAMVACGWLDRCAKHRLVIHEWENHAPEMIRKRNSRAGIEFAVLEPIEADGIRCPPSGIHPEDNGCPPVPTSPVQSPPVQSRGADASRPPSGSDEDWEWIFPFLRKRLAARATEAELRLWLEFRYDEILARCRSEAEDPSDVWDAVISHAISSWLAYLRERDPERRQYHREAHLRALQAAKAAVDRPRQLEPPEPVPPDDDPLALLRAGANPHVSN